MLSITLLAGVVLVVYYVGTQILGLRRNLAAAKQSGLPYVVVPVYQWDMVWLLSNAFVMPMIKKLPKALTHPWGEYIHPEWNWHHKYAPFKDLKSDVIIMVSPRANTVYVADPAATVQITTRKADFPKPIAMYQVLDIYGKNVVTTETSIWRQHRKIASVPFTEKSNALVFEETITQAQSMVASWNDGPISTVAADAMRLSLHVISLAGFGVALSWPHEDNVKASVIPPGHTMAYQEALVQLLDNVEAIIILPKWLLRNGTKTMRVAHEAYIEWGKYMNELYQSKKQAIRSGKLQDAGVLDLMGALCQGAGLTAESLGDPEKQAPQMLTDDEIMGNAFVFMLAGHETTANVIHYSLVMLALHAASQKHMQADIDDVFGSRKPSAWKYDQDIPKLFGNMVGAVMNETLRLIGGVVNIPKSTPEGHAQPLTLASGKRVLIPAGAFVNLTTTGLHYNPTYWTSPSMAGKSEAEITKDIETFRPERWLEVSAKQPDASGISNLAEQDDEHGGPGGLDTSEHLFRPVRGSFIPFSEGARACIGRRFAQVESLAALAVILQTHSVELAVDEWASDAELKAMSADEKRAVFDKAAAAVHHLFREGMETRVTLQLRKGVVPLRFRRRGEEVLQGETVGTP